MDTSIDISGDRTMGTSMDMTSDISIDTFIDITIKVSMDTCMDIYIYMDTYVWMWVINPLVPGWGTGPEKTRFPKCFVLPYNGTWFSSGFWYRGSFLKSRSGRQKRMVTLLDFRPEKQMFVMTKSTIFMYQNCSNWLVSKQD